MFKNSLLDSGTMGKTKKPITVAISFMAQSIVMGILMLIPLLYGEALPAYRLMTTLVAPPPPPPPPPPAAVVPRVRITPRLVPAQQLIEPNKVPRQIVRLIEEPLPPMITGIVPGNTVEISQSDFSGVNKVEEPPPPPPAPQKPITIATSLAAAKLISQPKPIYPALAIQTRTQGTVHLQALIDKEGSIENLTVVSGHPLLIPAALDAVKQWRYQPTLLNGVAVEVITTVDVNFTLGN